MHWDMMTTMGDNGYCISCNIVLIGNFRMGNIFAKISNFSSMKFLQTLPVPENFPRRIFTVRALANDGNYLIYMNDKLHVVVYIVALVTLVRCISRFIQRSSYYVN